MTESVLAQKSTAELRLFFTKELELILVRILTKLGIDISFPVELEELILSIPEDLACYSDCQKVYSTITEDIKSDIKGVIISYQNLLNFEKDLSCSR